MSASLAAVMAWDRDEAGRPVTAVLVEGRSDQAAIEALAARHGRDLRAEGVAIVAMGGATNLGRFLDLLGPAGRDLRLAGLCDAAEAAAFGRSLRRAGADSAGTDDAGAGGGPDGGGLDRAGLARLGFFVCVADLEDELIRAAGMAAIEAAIEASGELRALRTFRSQPAQRGRTAQQQLRRFMGSQSGRKAHYARLLAGALDPARVPEPLDRLLAWL
jgi:hypothetical protein